MAELDRSPKLSQASGLRRRVLVLAALGLCALPCVLLALIWRDRVSISGAAPFVAIACATVAAIATLIGLDLIVRPLAQAGTALGQLMQGEAFYGFRRVQLGGHVGFVRETHRDIEEFIALRAEHKYSDPTEGLIDRALFVQVLSLISEPAHAVVVIRVLNGAPFALGSSHDEVVRPMMSETARRLHVHYGPDLAIAKIGSDLLAFTVPIENVDLISTADFMEGVRGIISELERPILFDDLHFIPQVLAGVAPLSTGDSPDKSIGHALSALESATFGTAVLTSPVIFYNEEVRHLTRDRFVMAQELRSAVRNQEFELYYQPIVDISRNRPVGAEALIRWNSPSRGFVSPGMFIPLAEASGLIDPIGLWVLREACREAATWDPSLSVAINLGARQFLDVNLPWHVSEAIKSADIRPEQLEIELTASMALIDHQHARTIFGALRDIGVRVAMDDLGKGNANLSILRNLPFTTLKIDRDFVKDVHRNPASRAICDSLIALGTGLGLSVVAKGTEQTEEVALLSGRGCRVFQGYYFARPVPAHVLAATFENLPLKTVA